jgi:hypothetical protein
LCAGQRNSEIVIGILHGAVLAWINHVQQVSLDILVIKHDAVNLTRSFWGDALWQKLQSTNAVPTNGREKVECVDGASLEPGCDAFANSVAVRQQSIEVVGTRSPFSGSL